MSLSDTITAIVAIAALAAAFYALYTRDTRRDRRILSEMKLNFFPRLTDNLRTISEKLARREMIPTPSYEEQLYSGLTKTLLIEFRLRFQRQGEILENLKDELAKYPSRTGEELEAKRRELQDEIDRLTREIEELKGVERIPARRPRLP